METIHLTQPPEGPIDNAGEKVLALGYFDGIHLGHQKVIKTAIDIAREKGQKAAVMTFHPHPSVVLKKMSKREDYLTPPAEKAALLKEMGVDILYFVRFDQAFSRLSPQDFIDQYVIRLNVKHVVAGFDFSYGRMAKGTMETLSDHSRNMFGVTTIPKFTIRDKKVSTTHIRELILDGKVHEAIAFLGRPYQMSGMVVHGDKRGGATLGFPTANVKTHEPYVCPSQGIYAVRMEVEHKWYEGMGYIGERPTFYEGAKPVVIEINLFDFDQTIYGETVKVEWHAKMRDDIAFTNVDDLITQMSKDKQDIIQFFHENH
ncbi:riboflavin kinase/FMN adenylyltransferase [Pullulanibacillus pueri]|uniref:Riboflavin biosynthesis protein n=1 Tax=Pullulanibacillus pueri TaxID=1437324 RepID=A0A8J3ELQ9_9BACL|nr:riboflavin biosynthesis protein RibF [Pullulanibacillus pueri]MBM7682522.1 riboflavin kinase/FMN adenylyltransferase [Pullulanibacillus pueri]GGH82065.1 riboflavin biosynthesis protein [Pullulanibacillus pueri]